MKAFVKNTLSNHNQETSNFVKEIKEQNNILDIRGSWRFNNYLTPAYAKKDLSLSELKAVIEKRYLKLRTVGFDKLQSKLVAIEGSKKIKEIRISIEWKRSAMWGSNPTCEAQVCFNDNTCEHVNSGSISGCGYDKESTAIAAALNKSLSFRKMICALNNKAINKDDFDSLPYGFQSFGKNAYIPSLAGGVGTSCYYRCAEAMKGEFLSVSHGKTYDVYLWKVGK